MSARAGQIVSRDASEANRPAALGPDSISCTGVPPLKACRYAAMPRALRMSRERGPSRRGELDVLHGAVMLHTPLRRACTRRDHEVHPFRLPWHVCTSSGLVFDKKSSPISSIKNDNSTPIWERIVYGVPKPQQLNAIPTPSGGGTDRRQPNGSMPALAEPRRRLVGVVHAKHPGLVGATTVVPE